MQHVFISYVREDKQLVGRLCQALKSHDIEIWWDLQNLDPGVRWKSEIQKAIREGAFFIACFSKKYHGRDKTYMNEELTIAIEELRQRPTDRVWFIPVKLDDCEIPDIDIGYGGTLKDIHAAVLYEKWDVGIQCILKSVSPNINQDRIGDFINDTNNIINVPNSRMSGGITTIEELLTTPCPILDPNQSDRNMKEFSAWYRNALWQTPKRLPEHETYTDYTNWDVYKTWWSTIGWHRDRGHQIALRQERLQDVRANLNLIKSLPISEDWGELHGKAVGNWEPEIPANPDAPHYEHGVFVHRHEIQRDVHADFSWYHDHQETMYPFEIERAMLVRFDEERCAALAWQIVELKNVASASDYKGLQMHNRNDFDLLHKEKYPKWYKNHIRKYRKRCRAWWESIGKAAYDRWWKEEVMVHGYTETAEDGTKTIFLPEEIRDRFRIE